MASAFLLPLLLALACCQASIIFNESPDTIALCPENGLSDGEAITLVCDEPTSAMHVDHLAVHQYLSINHTDCSSDPDELRCLMTETDDLVNECEGAIGNCTFYLVNSCKSVNFIEVRYECVRAELIVNWCSHDEVSNASSIYLQTNDFLSNLPPPTEVSCKCDIIFSKPQSLTLYTYFMELEPRWEQECTYDWWKLTVDYVKDERKCDTIKGEETVHAVTEVFTLELKTDHVATDEEGVTYRGGWLKLSPENPGVHLKCERKNNDGWYQTTWTGPTEIVVPETTTSIPPPLTSYFKPTTTRAPSATTRSITQLPPTTTINWAPPKLQEQPEFIVGVTVGVVVSAALIGTAAYFLVSIFRKARRGSREINSAYQFTNGEMWPHISSNNNNNNNNSGSLPKQPSNHEYDVVTVTTEDQLKEAALRPADSISTSGSSHTYQQLISQQPSPLYAVLPQPPNGGSSKTVSV